MPTPNVTLEQLYAGITRPAGKMHQLVLHRIGAHFLGLDVGFEHNSAVLRPWSPEARPGEAASEQRTPPFGVLKQVFDYAEQNPGKKLLIAGHSDASGGAQYNRKLSELRARNVHALLTNDRDAWATSCEARHGTRDIQTLLKWAAWAHGYGCDPGEIDGRTGPKTLRARERFRQRYNEEFAGHLTVCGPMTLDTWKAFFDLYQVTLARVLGVPESGLAAKRKVLSFLSEAVLGVGEHYPHAIVPKKAAKSAANRRVDFVFFDEAGFPSLGAQEPPGYELYGTNLRFRRDVIAASSTLRQTKTVVFLNTHLLDDCSMLGVSDDGAGAEFAANRPMYQDETGVVVALDAQVGTRGDLIAVASVPPDRRVGQVDDSAIA